MISELFRSNSFNNVSQNRLQLYQGQDLSPKLKERQNFSKYDSNFQIRKQKIDSLSTQIKKVIQRIVLPIYGINIASLQEAQFLTIKGTKNLFFGQISISLSKNSFFKNDSKTAQGLCQIFFDNGNYLIGQFIQGSLQSQFIYILQNGNYIRCQKKKKLSKKSNLGFRTQDSDTVSQIIHSSDSEQIQQEDVKLSIFEFKLPISLTILQSQIFYNGVFYKGTLKQGYFNGKVYQKGRDYTFEGYYFKGQRKNGKYISQFQIQYQGTFKNNKFDGLGTLKTKDGVYTGQFKNGLKDGQGQFIWPDKSSYKGDFKKDKRHGKGQYKSSQGSFKGQWKNDQIQGTGYLVMHGKGIGGQWRRDSFQSPNTFY